MENQSILELDILGMENHLTESNRSTEATEEDAFALKLRRLGGTFFQYATALGVMNSETPKSITCLGGQRMKSTKVACGY